MQRLFAEDPMIRPMVDFAAKTGAEPPMMILEPFQKTLWDARKTRPLTMQEIKWIMKGCLLGIMTVHRNGLVYTDLKMENVGVSGFDNEKPNDDPRQIKVRLADLGSISEPGTREISALTYRGPEVHFGKPWDYSTDYAQLLLAHVDFKSPGMYDNIDPGSFEEKEEKIKAVRDALAIDFELHSLPFYTEDARARELLPPPQAEQAYKWTEDMFDKGIAQEDIQFLANVLNPLPRARDTTVEILESRYLEI
ncbi:protein kinase [Achaetomium macrosporum]|uniref:Protein kinase n=1 Tax=Achaetomium macrosporum TaxID=79813 RepID=A0AAN7HI25_9PEZI|nr:protein kinase [Achaetomium macrosporum]